MVLLGNFRIRSRDACFYGKKSAHADYATKPSMVLNVKALNGVCCALKAIQSHSPCLLRLKIIFNYFFYCCSLHNFSIWFFIIGLRNVTAKNQFPWYNFIWCRQFIFVLCAPALTRSHEPMSWSLCLFTISRIRMLSGLQWKISMPQLAAKIKTNQRRKKNHATSHERVNL